MVRDEPQQPERSQPTRSNPASASNPWYGFLERPLVSGITSVLSLIVAVAGTYYSNRTAILALEETRRHNQEQSAIAYRVILEPRGDKPVVLTNRVPASQFAINKYPQLKARVPVLARPEPSAEPKPHLTLWLQFDLINQGARTFSLSDVTAFLANCALCPGVTVEEVNDVYDHEVKLPVPIEPGHDLRTLIKVAIPTDDELAIQYLAEHRNVSTTLEEYESHIGQIRSDAIFQKLLSEEVETVSPLTTGGDRVTNPQPGGNDQGKFQQALKALFNAAATTGRMILGVEVQIAGLDNRIVREIELPLAR